MTLARYGITTPRWDDAARAWVSVCTKCGSTLMAKYSDDLIYTLMPEHRCEMRMQPDEREPRTEEKRNV